MHWFNVTLPSCLLVLLVCAGCSGSKPYERHVEPAYDEHGQLREGYATINLDFLEALNEDLVACYKEKQVHFRMPMPGTYPKNRLTLLEDNRIQPLWKPEIVQQLDDFQREAEVTQQWTH